MKVKNKVYIDFSIIFIFSTLIITLNIIHKIRMDNTIDFIECVSIHDINNVKLCKNTFIPPIEIILQCISVLIILFSIIHILIISNLLLSNSLYQS